MKRKRKVRDYHVVYRAPFWIVRREGGKRAVRVLDTQEDAINFAARRAKRAKVEVVIHRTDGTIRDSDSYGREGKVRDAKH